MAEEEDNDQKKNVTVNTAWRPAKKTTLLEQTAANTVHASGAS